MTDLTREEQDHVRAALRFMRTRWGGAAMLAKALGCRKSRIGHVLSDESVTASLAFRVARTVGVGLDDLLAGKYPPEGACPHCGHVAEPKAVAEAH